MSRLQIDFAPEKEHLLPQLLYVSCSKGEKNTGSIMHSHSFTEFLFVDGGEGEVLTRERAFPVRGGDLVVFPSGLYHAEKSGGEKNMEYYVLAVSNIAVKGNADPVMKRERGSARIGEDIKRLFSVLRDHKELYEIEVRSVFLDMLQTLLSLPSSPFSLVDAETRMEPMAAVKDYIDTHYTENFSLDDLASLFHLSKYHLVREFSRAYECSPMSYLENRRIDEAKYLLSTTRLSMNGIAAILGFSSSSYFSQRFRSAADMTPMDYRRKLEKEKIPE